MEYKNLAHMFYHSGEREPDGVAMMYKQDGEWKPLTYSHNCTQVKSLAAGLTTIGVSSGDNVAILAENSYNWAYADYAILSLGAVTAPIYPTLLSEHIEYIINDCKAEVLFVSNADQFAKLTAIESSIPSVKHFILFDDAGVSHPKVSSIASLIEAGESYLAENPGAIEKSVEAIKRDQLATFVYTSGTTGEPKGVMLTHGNLLSNIEASIRALTITSAEIFLSFLPLSHIFERMVGHFLANYVGARICYAESIESVPENMIEIKPTVVASVPRLFEKIYAKVLAGVEAGSPAKQKIFHWAVGVGRVATDYRQKQKPLSGLVKLKYGLAHKLVFSKLHERVGGRIRLFCSGGAPLPREIGEFFTAAGLLILEGYGLSETSPVISVNRLEKFKFGSVGVPIDNCEVKIAEDGEILARGPNIMLGYYNKPEATAEAIDDDGWFHTGDIGMFDEEGFLKITDRKKNIIVTAGGKNVAPQKIENMLVTMRYVEQALVIGDRRKFCSAVIVPSFEALETYCADIGLNFDSHDAMLEDASILALIQTDVEKVNENCASYESIKKFVAISQPFTIESGELTPSLKVKRKAVETNYAARIDALYS